MTPKEVIKATGYVVGYGILIIILISVAWEVAILLGLVQSTAP